MTSVVEFYEQLASAPDDKTRARLIAEAFERIEKRYAGGKGLATQSGMRETEPRLQKEITENQDRVRLEILRVQAALSKDIEQLRAALSQEIKQLREGLSKEIEQLRATVTAEMARTKVDIIKWTAGMLMVQLGLFGALLKLLLP